MKGGWESLPVAEDVNKWLCRSRSSRFLGAQAWILILNEERRFSREQSGLAGAKKEEEKKKKKKKKGSPSGRKSNSTSSSSSSSSKIEGGTGLFNEEDKLQRIWRRYPGALTAGALREARQGLMNQARTLWKINQAELRSFHHCLHSIVDSRSWGH